MIRISGLTVLILIELIIILTVVAGYLLYRLRKTGGLGGTDAGSFKVVLANIVGRRMQEAGGTPAGAAAGGGDASAMQELKEARVRILRLAAERLEKSGAGAPQAWDAVATSFDDVLKGAISGKHDLLQEQEVSRQKLASLAALQEERERLKDLAYRQAAKIADLFGYKDVLSDAKKRLDAVEAENRELRKKADVLLEGSSQAEASRLFLKDFERNDAELARCIETIQQENDRLTGDHLAWQKELRSFEEGRGRTDRKGAGAGGGSEEQEARVRELEQQLADRENQVKEVQRKLEALEQEYLVLYKEQH